MNYAAIAAPEGGVGGAAPAGGGQAQAAARPAKPAPAAAQPLNDAEVQIMDKQHNRPSAKHNQDFLYKRRLILKIRQYATAFPEECGKQVSGKDLENLTEPDLECLMQEIKFTVGSRASSIVTNQMAGAGLIGLEGFLKDKLDYEVCGPEVRLSQIMSSEDCQYLVKELSLEYMDIIYTRPEIRAGIYLFNAVQTIDSINRKSIDGTLVKAPAVVGEKRKEPETPAGPPDRGAAQPPPPKEARPNDPPSVPGALIIEEVAPAPMPAMPVENDGSVVRPAVLRGPAPSAAKPKPAPGVARK